MFSGLDKLFKHSGLHFMRVLHEIKNTLVALLEKELHSLVDQLLHGDVIVSLEFFYVPKTK
jgi:hypothetical protein